MQKKKNSEKLIPARYKLKLRISDKEFNNAEIFERCKYVKIAESNEFGFEPDGDKVIISFGRGSLSIKGDVFEESLKRFRKFRKELKKI